MPMGSELMEGIRAVEISNTNAEVSPLDYIWEADAPDTREQTCQYHLNGGYHRFPDRRREDNQLKGNDRDYY